MFLKEVLLKILLYTQEIFSPAAPARVPRIPEFWPPHFQGLSIACSGFLFLKAVALLYQPVSMKGGRHCVSHFCPVQGAYWCRRSQKVHQTCHWFWGWINRICLLCHGKVVPLVESDWNWIPCFLFPGLFVVWLFFSCLNLLMTLMWHPGQSSPNLASPKLMKAALMKSWAYVGMSKLQQVQKHHFRFDAVVLTPKIAYFCRSHFEILQLST